MTVKEFVIERKAKLAKEISAFPKKPHLVIIQANDNPASDAYIRGKMKDAGEIGADATLLKFDPSITEEALLKEIRRCNEDDSVTGLIVQLPLPKHISEAKVKLAVSPEKDVDGFHPITSFTPCTPKGIVDYLTAIGFSFRGKNAVVLGRSNIVGMPMAKLLLSKDCNVTVLHSKTTDEDRRNYIANADLIVVAIGKEAYLNSSFSFRPSCYVIDVGINRGEDGKLHGDAEPDLPVAMQTPVPGGVGLLTRLALIENLVLAYKMFGK